MDNLNEQMDSHRFSVVIANIFRKTALLSILGNHHSSLPLSAITPVFYMAAQLHMAFTRPGASKAHRMSVLQASLQQAKAPGRSNAKSSQNPFGQRLDLVLNIPPAVHCLLN